MKFRPEADIWPMMSEQELRALAADIDANGQLYPISIYQDEILDGRNRWAAMTRYGKTQPQFETVNPDSLIHFVISHNEKRRHLTDSQRGLAASAALPFFEAEAKRRQVETGKIAGRGQDKSSAPIGADLLPRRAADDAAVAFSTTPRNVQRGKTVRSKGSKKLVEAVAQGQLTLGKAEQIVSSYPDKKRQDAQVDVVAKSKMVTRVKGLTGEIEWYTPRKYLDAAVEVMGAIDLDPASSAAAQDHVQAHRHYTMDDDGLSHDWSGRVFLNPPYAMPHIKSFTHKLVDSFGSGSVREGILLTNNATDTEWFHTAMNACTALCFTRGRIRFLEASNGELVEKGAPTHGQAFFYFGPQIDRFTQVFSRFGIVVSRFETALMQEAAE